VKGRLKKQAMVFRFVISNFFELLAAYTPPYIYCPIMGGHTQIHGYSAEYPFFGKQNRIHIICTYSRNTADLANQITKPTVSGHVSTEWTKTKPHEVI
jgi:hypothetical protein